MVEETMRSPRIVMLSSSKISSTVAMQKKIKWVLSWEKCHRHLFFGSIENYLMTLLFFLIERWSGMKESWCYYKYNWKNLFLQKILKSRLEIYKLMTSDRRENLVRRISKEIINELAAAVGRMITVM